MTTADRLSRSLALTFDDGPGPSTEPLLDVLDRAGARATFFVLGDNLRGAAFDGSADRAFATAVRAVRAGHVLGNHTMTHARSGAQPLTELRAEIDAATKLILEVYAAAGVAPPKPLPFRLPFGPWGPDGGRDTRLELLAELSIRTLHWTGVFDDWYPACDAGALHGALRAHIGKRWIDGKVPVILLHDAGTPSERATFGVERGATVEAVARLCASLAPETPQYLTLDEPDAIESRELPPELAPIWLPN
jgi:chitin deacetylase